MPNRIVLTAITALGVVGATATLAENLKAPKDGGVRRWEVIVPAAQMRTAPTEDSDILQDLTTGQLLVNRGCAEETQPIWCEVRVLRGRAAGFVQHEQLSPARGPDGLVPYGLDDSKKRVGKRDFDMKSEAPCAQEQGQALAPCPTAVARGGGGDATVVVTFPNGFKRQLFFVHGEFVRGNTTMSGVGTDTEWEVVEGVYKIRVDDQRFDLPVAFVLGN